jgi:hypothetical protein
MRRGHGDFRKCTGPRVHPSVERGQGAVKRRACRPQEQPTPISSPYHPRPPSHHQDSSAVLPTSATAGSATAGEPLTAAPAVSHQRKLTSETRLTRLSPDRRQQREKGQATGRHYKAHPAHLPGATDRRFLIIREPRGPFSVLLTSPAPVCAQTCFSRPGRPPMHQVASTHF